MLARGYSPVSFPSTFVSVTRSPKTETEADRKEAAYRLRTYRHKAYYSLDCGDGIEHEAIFFALSPYKIYERKVSMQELYAAMSF